MARIEYVVELTLDEREALLSKIRKETLAARANCKARILLKADDAILDTDATPVIPPRHDRRNPHKCDWRIHKERKLVERFFAKLKQFRRIATR